MLILTRREKEALWIGEDIRVVVVRMQTLRAFSVEEVKKIVGTLP